MVKTQGSFAVDMVVEMPRSIFQEKDYQNLRYFYRRAYYIAYVAAHVRDALGQSMEADFEFLNDNRLLPVLALHPKLEAGEDHDGTNGKKEKKASKKSDYTIRIIPCAPKDLFPPNKLMPTSNANKAAESDEKKATNTATPFYNSTLKAESTFMEYLKLLTAKGENSESKNYCPAFRDACMLGRIWLQQRGFSGAISGGGFGHFEWALTMALLLESGGRNGSPILSSSLSSTELFKATIQYLAERNFNKAPTILGKGNSDAARENGPVLFDGSKNLNILYKMTPSSASLLQMQAKSTMDLLADESADKFAPIFIVKANVFTQLYDAVFEINSPDLTKSLGSTDGHGAVWENTAEIYKVLKKAYGSRADLVHIHQPATRHWPLGASPRGETQRVLVGVSFDFPQMSRQMEHGPPAEEQKEAARFRQFWGEKAELRRFKDGSILECVEWKGRQAHDICEEITRYVLHRHNKLTLREEITFYAESFSSIVNFSPFDKEAFDSARRGFQTFEYDIRNLEDLPLQIRQLAPVSPLARYASIDPPLIGAHSSTVDPIDVNMYFEASSRWPENLVAIQEAKIEFLLDIDRRLCSAHDNITTHLGRENKELGNENLAFLDVIYDTGAAFRVRIHCDLEEILLERQQKNRTLEHYVRDEADETLARFHWQFTTLPLHTQTIATFCTRLPTLSGSIRLAKQWFNSHKLTSHISQELIELFVLHVFLHPYPWKIPSSSTTGFLRTLDFLSRWDWRDEALIIDSAEEMSSDERLEIRKNLEEWRKKDPNMNHMTLFVATSHDHSGLAYTRNGPSKLIASRMTRLAKAACKLVKEEDYNLDPVDLFETSLQDYDVLIQLSARAVKNIMRSAASDSAARKASQFKNLDSQTGKAPLPIRAHPVDVLLGELGRLYEETLIFFRGDSAADDDDLVVGAIWNPKLKRQKFRVGLPYNFHGVDEEDGNVVEVNKKAVLLEIARIGGDMIKKIEEVEDEEEDEA